MRIFRDPFRFLSALALLSAFIPAARAQNPGVVEIANPAVYRQVVAISDVHGEYDHLRHLLQSAKVIDAFDHWAAGKTLVVVIGDNIDKGPMSYEVLEFWMRLQKEAPRSGGRIVTLLGNHEAEFLAKPNGKKAALFVGEAARQGVNVDALTSDTAPVGHFLRSMPVAARVGKWVFCHAGWVPKMNWPTFVSTARTTLASGDYSNDFFIGDDSILETKDGPDGKKWYDSPDDIRELESRISADGLYGLVLGHQPNAFEIQDNVGIYKDGRIFKVDSGMAPDEKDNNPGHAGHLLLFKKPAELAASARPANAYSVASDGSQAKL